MLEPLIGATVNLKLIEQHFDDILRFASSIEHETVTASLILRKLAAGRCNPRGPIRSPTVCCSARKMQPVSIRLSERRGISRAAWEPPPGISGVFRQYFRLDNLIESTRFCCMIR